MLDADLNFCDEEYFQYPISWRYVGYSVFSPALYWGEDSCS